MEQTFLIHQLCCLWLTRLNPHLIRRFSQEVDRDVFQAIHISTVLLISFALFSSKKSVGLTGNMTAPIFCANNIISKNLKFLRNSLTLFGRSMMNDMAGDWEEFTTRVDKTGLVYIISNNLLNASSFLSMDYRIIFFLIHIHLSVYQVGYLFT